MSRCLIVAEVAQAHEGSVGIAHSFIDGIADAGADAVKFQTHLAAAESTPAEPFRVKLSSQDATRYDYWQRMEFSEATWRELAEHARDRGLLFLSSPFSVEAVELLERIDVPMWKVASGEVTTPGLMERMLASGKPVLLSTGMSSLAEIDRVVDQVREAGSDLTVMQCTTAYPCPPEKVGLNLMAEFRDRYGCAVGLSDHTGTIYAGLAAVALGAAVVEVHVTFSRKMYGPDVDASLTFDELSDLVFGTRVIERMMAHPVDKDRMAEELRPLRRLFSKSLVTRVDLVEGTVLGGHHLTAKKPGTGIPADQLSKVIGARLCRDVKAGELLEEADLEGWGE